MRKQINIKIPEKYKLSVLILSVFFALSVEAQEKKDQLKGETLIYSVDHPARHVFNGSVSAQEDKGKGNPSDIYKSGFCPTQGFDRTIDGTCNNISTNNAASWGSAIVPLLRAIPDVYNSNNDLVGQDRRNPREISNIIFKSDCAPSSKRLSSFVFTWGQFLDHDISVSPEDDTESEPIPALPNDNIIVDIPFHRSDAYPGTIVGATRQQYNILTAWIDGSNVYGSDATRANYLRTFVDGKLKVSTAANGDLLPWNTSDNEMSGTIDPNAPFMAGNVNPMTGNPVKVFVAGDHRANEQSGLTSMHVLFMREHNRICDDLIATGMTGDEVIYQRARKEVGAIIQSITYNEFLPALGIQMPNYNGYDNTVQPDIMNVFSTAAYRLGHTMVTDGLLLYDDNENNIGNLSLRDAFFKPSFLFNDGIEGVLNGLAQQFQEEIDAKIVENLRTFLFAPGPGPGFDLAALNIQRGRDHGLDHYNAFRQFFTGTSANSFADISSDPIVQQQLATAYDNDVNNIDVWVGLLAEDHAPNSAVGATLNAILSDQFSKLRDGDFYFYENDPAFTAAERNTIDNTTLSNVIKRNTNIVNIKNQVFYAPCPVSKNLSSVNNITGNGNQTHKVSSTITANNLVDNASSAVYDGGFDVTLTAGFDAEMGSNFHALINGCNSGAFNKTGTNEVKPALADLQASEIKVFNRPNPFSDFTTIEFNLPKTNQISLTVSDATGKVVDQLLNNQEMQSGEHQIDFDGSNLPDGIYIINIQTNDDVISQKMILSK